MFIFPCGYTKGKSQSQNSSTGKIRVAKVTAMLSWRRVDIDRRRSENVGHMKEISTPTATLLLT
jgi:hypothetical protein